MNSAPISTACASLGRLSVCILGLQSAEATVEDRFINAQQICPHALWMKSTDSVEAHWEKLVAQTGSLCSLWTRNPSNEDPRLFSRSSSHCWSLQGGNSYQTLHTLPLHLINIQLKLCNSFLIFVKKQTKKNPSQILICHLRRCTTHTSSRVVLHTGLVRTGVGSHVLHWREVSHGISTSHLYDEWLSRKTKPTVHRRGAQYKPTATPPERSKACNDAAFCVLTAPLDDQCVTIRARHMYVLSR